MKSETLPHRSIPPGGAPLLGRADAVLADLAAGALVGVERRVLVHWLATELRGPIAKRLLDVAARFRDAGPPRDDDDAWTLLALRARVALEREASSLDDVELLERLDAIDAALAPAGGALLTLDQGDYDDAVAGAALDREAWWGWRARIDALLPESELDLALKELRLTMR